MKKSRVAAVMTCFASLAACLPSSGTSQSAPRRDAATSGPATEIARIANSNVPVPPEVMRIMIRTLFTSDSVAYRASLSQMPFYGEISNPDWIRTQLSVLTTRYDAVRGELGRNFGLLAIPPVDESVTGKTKPIQVLESHLAKRIGNPVHIAVDTVVNEVLRTAATQMLRPRPEADWRAFVDSPITIASLSQAESVLNDQVRRRGSAYRDLPDATKVEVLEALQFEVKRGIKQFDERGDRARLQSFGRDVRGTAKTMDEITRGVGVALQIIEQANQLDKTYVPQILAAQASFEDQFLRAAQQIESEVQSSLNQQDLLSVATASVNLHTVAVALRTPKPVQELTRHVQSIRSAEAEIRNAQVVINRTQVLIQQSEGLVETTTAYLGAGDQLLGTVQGLAAGLKLPSATLRKVNSAVNTAKAAIGVASSLASGNVFGAVGAIGGLFGGAGPDVGELRHQELLSRFEEVDRQLRELQRGQQVIMAQISELDKKVDKLGIQVARNHAEVMQTLGDINRNVLWVGRLINADDANRFNQCQNVLEFYAKEDYAARAAFAQIRHGSVAACRVAMSSLTVDPRGGRDFTRLLWLDAYDMLDASGQEHSRFTAAVVAPMVQYLNNVWLPKYGQNEALKARMRSALATPSLSLDRLVEKRHRARSEDPERAVPETLFSFPLQDSVVVLFSQRIRDLHAIYTFLENDGRLRDWSVLFDPTRLPLQGASLPGEPELKSALQAIDYAITQQTLLIGDILLPELSEAISSQEVASLTRKNIPLALNTVRYAVYEIAESEGITPGAYAAALQSNDESVMRNLMVRKRASGNQQLQVRRSQGRFEMQIRDQWIPMPGAGEFERREFVASMALQRLLAEREALLDVYAGYLMVRKMTPAERTAFYRLSLIQ
jgi:hypothetical protein